MADGYAIATSVLIGGATAPRLVDSGVIIHIAAVFTNSAGTAANPGTVKFSYRADAIGTTTTYTYGVGTSILRGSTGNYYVDLDTNESAGRWEWNFFATGAGQAADHDFFYVRPTAAV